MHSSVCSQRKVIPPSLVCGVYVHPTLQLPGPVIAVRCSASSSTLFGGKLCITVLQNLCFPGCRLSSARDPHYGPRSTTSLHGDGDGFLPSSGWHFLQHLPSVRPVTALWDAPLETEPPAQEFTAQWPSDGLSTPGKALDGICVAPVGGRLSRLGWASPHRPRQLWVWDSPLGEINTCPGAPNPHLSQHP